MIDELKERRENNKPGRSFDYRLFFTALALFIIFFGIFSNKLESKEREINALTLKIKTLEARVLNLEKRLLEKDDKSQDVTMP